MNRNYQLDFFRGLFLIIITIDHFFSDNNIIRSFTHEYLGWVSAAEGFVFISGLTAGLVYTYKFVEKGPAYISAAAKKRAWVIYKYHIILLLLSIAILFSHYAFREFWLVSFDLVFQKPFLAVMMGSLLIYQPIYLDILPMYAIFLLLVPMVIKGFEKNYTWPILLVSGVLYLIGTCDISLPYLDRAPLSEYADLGNFDLLCWQFLFVGGIFLGFLMYHGKTHVLLKNNYLFSIAAITSLSLFILKQLLADVDGGTITSALGEYAWISKFSFVDKENLRPVRLLNFAALVFVVAFIARKNKNWFTSKPICYLGTSSLEVFSLHVLLVILLKPLKDYTNNFYAVHVRDEFYFYPISTSILLFIIIPALFMIPLIKKRSLSRLKTKTAL